MDALQRNCLMVVTREEEFYRMIEISCTPLFDRIIQTEILPPAVERQLLLMDLDAFPAGLSYRGVAVGYARREISAPFPVLRRPFPVNEMLWLLEEAQKSAFDPDGDANCSDKSADATRTAAASAACTLRLRGKNILLTPREALLFRKLYENRGTPVKKAELALLFSGTGSSMLPVYIHYLRKKLEADGKKRILSVPGGYVLTGDDLTFRTFQGG